MKIVVLVLVVVVVVAVAVAVEVVEVAVGCNRWSHDDWSEIKKIKFQPTLKTSLFFK